MLFLLDDFLLLFYSMILIIVCHAIVPETTTVCLLVEGHNKTSWVTSKKLYSVSGSSFRRTLCATSLHKKYVLHKSRAKKMFCVAKLWDHNMLFIVVR